MAHDGEREQDVVESLGQAPKPLNNGNAPSCVKPWYALFIMARPYASEMAKLAETFAWAGSVDIDPLRRAIRTAGISPLRAIGSGGSLTAAHALASFHQRFTHRIATIATPLEAIEEPLDSNTATWLLSAGGSNVDILAATEALISREPRQLGVLCGRIGSPLTDLCQAHPFVDLMIYPPPTGKDGFLATNSLLGFTALLLRAYVTEFGDPDEWLTASGAMESLLLEESEALTLWRDATTPLWTRPTTLVLYGPATRIGAIDLESKFTEAALGNLQLADYRNFAHGRHHWLAKRGETSSVLALVCDADRSLANRTLALIPRGIPQARLEFFGNASATAIASLIAALRVTGWAGSARGIDPGRPGVPEFGRKLYNLSLSRSSKGDVVRGLPPRDAAAIQRKTGMAPAILASNGELEFWRKALHGYRGRLLDSIFEGVVLDYDGTVVETRRRELPPDPEMVVALTRIVKSGARLAIATGRGKSIRHELQAVFPKELWPEILLGYYNGAEISSLADDSSPDGTNQTNPPLRELAKALREQPELAAIAKQTDRRHQITLEARRVTPEGRLWDLAHQTILSSNDPGVTVTRSSHSIDILAPGVSKLNVVARLRGLVGSAPLLSIGDRGRWPGNDYDLLRNPNALGVDEVNADPATCWNLSLLGQRGPAVTMAYLLGLEAHVNGLRFSEGALR